MPLQTQLLRWMVNELHINTVRSWFRNLEGCDKDHFLFSMLNLCHTIKSKFSQVESNHIYQQQWGDQKPVIQPYLVIKDYVEVNINRLQ